MVNDGHFWPTLTTLFVKIWTLKYINIYTIRKSVKSSLRIYSYFYCADAGNLPCKKFGQWRSFLSTLTKLFVKIWKEKYIDIYTIRKRVKSSLRIYSYFYCADAGNLPCKKFGQWRSFLSTLTKLFAKIWKEKYIDIYTIRKRVKSSLRIYSYFKCAHSGKLKKFWSMTVIFDQLWPHFLSKFGH